MTARTRQVDVCICAYARRDGLRRLLQSLATQVGAPVFRVLIADNHAQPTVAAWLATDAQAWPFEWHVLHAPQSNIAVARNALLDAATADWLAFIDDDETASPAWLADLCAARDGADVVFGPVQAQYPSTAPAWLVRGDFLSKRPARRGDGYDTGHSANVLIRRERIGRLRFDPELGRTGGEDTLFFASMHDAGARLTLCANAWVFEPADARRSTCAALMRRSLASGHAHARMLRMRGQGRIYLGLFAVAKCAVCVVLAASQVFSAVGWRRQILRAALHAGVVAHACGVSSPQIYGTAPSHEA